MMNMNPNLNQSIYGREMREELGLVRSEIAEQAFIAREDKAVHQAILMQGQHTLNLLKPVTSLWTDTYAKLLRETKVEPTLAENEIAYSTALADLLESHLEMTWASFDGRAGERETRARLRQSEADTVVMAASRHHAAIAGFCSVYITKLKDRAEELQAEATAAFTI